VVCVIVQQWAIAQSLPVMLCMVVGVVLVVERCCSGGLVERCGSAPPVGVGDELNALFYFIPCSTILVVG
jgi:hypothetical protein